MSTRSKSKLAAASNSKATQVPQTQGHKAKAPSRKPTQVFQSDTLKKENVKVKKPTKTAGKTAPKVELCTCQRGDDGSPMVFCGSCKIWCVMFVTSLSRPDVLIRQGIILLAWI